MAQDSRRGLARRVIRAVRQRVPRRWRRIRKAFRRQVLYRIARARLWARWKLRRRPVGVPTSAVTDGDHGIARCDVVYINLDRRADRRTSLEQQLASIGRSDATRFSAVEASPGILGCGQSHRAVLAGWEPDSPDRLLMVCEDDLMFVAPEEELSAVVEEFAQNPLLDVLVVANWVAWSIPISKRLAVSSNIQTTACYVVKQRAIEDLVLSMEESVRRLSAGDMSAANDKVWKQVQKKRFFAVPQQRLARQRPDFSDNLNTWADYGV